MELIRGLHNLRPHHRGCVGTVGAFDGVHRGHQALFDSLIETGRELNLPTVAICFEPLPREYFFPSDSPARLMSFREKFVALQALGLDRVLRIRFTDTFRAMRAEEFIKQVFVDGLGIRHIVVGDDLRFGAGRKGDANVLRAAGKDFGFAVEDTASVVSGDERISSSRIRNCLEQADFSTAEELLGRPFSLTGKVVYGRQLGRTLGVPTANMEMHRFRAPLDGVYAVEVPINGRLHRGVANVGTRPTIGDRTTAILEVHLLDYSGNLYGKTIDVVFKHRLRNEQKFDSIEVLRNTIHNDIAQCRSWFGIE
ncbi:MAG: bifunctional riboflavin kinase/FAD synthetase [Pseudomonadales bacterium]